MPKHHRVWNANMHEVYVREGRGCGSGSGYAPWIRVQDFASRGVVSRVKGRTTGRVHHLMSNYELAYFYILDWSDVVMDIREQYPLADLACAVNVAAQAGIKYPTDRISCYPYILTCDFMISTANGLKARTIKMTKELEKPRTLEKLEIERRYWLEKGIDWKIVTEHEIPYQKAKNIEWLSTSQGYYIQSCNFARAKNSLQKMLSKNEYSIAESIQAVEKEYGMITGMGLQLFKQLVWSGLIKLNLNDPLDFNARGAVTVA
jgi:hypothetical protein